MDADHEWTPVVLAAECPPCGCCGEALCPRCGDHYAECPCPGPHQDDAFYYRTRHGKLEAIPRDPELRDDDEFEPAAEFADEPDDSAEPDDQGEDDDAYQESLFDRIEWADFVAGDSLDGPIGGES